MPEEPKSDVAIVPRTFNPIEWTNANKVQVLALLNSFVYLLSTFGLALEDAQQGALMLVLNSLFALFAASTAGKSPVARRAARR